jgi:hypothetical protein
MQLFSIRCIRLNQDGTPVLDSQGNQSLPVTTKPLLRQLARVFTGWDPGCEQAVER